MQGGKGNWSWIWGNGKLKGCRAGSWLFQSEWRCGERRPKRHHRNTIHIKPVASRNPTPHLPSEASHGFQIQHEPPRRLIPSYFISKRRSHRQGGAGQESRQQIGFLRALVERREGGRKSYLLPLINGVYLKVVVVDSHSVIRVFEERVSWMEELRRWRSMRLSWYTSACFTLNSGLEGWRMSQRSSMSKEMMDKNAETPRNSFLYRFWIFSSCLLAQCLGDFTFARDI